MRHLLLGSLIFVGAAATTWIAVSNREAKSSGADAMALERLNTYCDALRKEFEHDADVLSTGNDKLREAAADRFLEPVAVHSREDLGLCMQLPPDLDPLPCWLRNDWQCLGRLERIAASAVSPGTLSTSSALHRLNDHCGGVRFAAKTAAYAFEHHQLYESWGRALGFEYSSPEDIALCSPWPNDVEHIGECRGRTDFDCLAQIAREVEASVYIPDDPER